MLKKLGILLLIGVMCCSGASDAFAKKRPHKRRPSSLQHQTQPHTKKQPITLKIVSEQQYYTWLGKKEAWSGKTLEKLLYNAAFRGQLGNVQKAMSKGAQCLDAALFAAAAGGHLETVQYLATHGASNFTKAMRVAQDTNHWQVAEWLRDFVSKRRRFQSDQEGVCQVASEQDDIEYCMTEQVKAYLIDNLNG